MLGDVSTFNISEKRLVKILITNLPNKTNYIHGEILDLTGLEIRALYNYGSSQIINNYITSPASGASVSTNDTKVVVSYTENNITCTAEFNINVRRQLSSIQLSGTYTTSYYAGDELDLDGLVVTAYYNNNTSQIVTNYTSSPVEGTILTTSTTNVIISYSEESVTKTAQYNITVEDPVRTITISGTGNSSYCYVSIDGSKKTASGSYTVDKGDTIIFGVYGRSSTYYGEVKIDDTQVLKVTNQTTKTYNYIVNNNLTISLSYTSSSSTRRGRITVITS